LDESKIITAKNKVVAVIGGGDTGSDCVGTARRQGAKQINQLEILPEPPDVRPPDTPWPEWPRIMRTSSSHEEGCQRQWSVMTKRFSGIGIRVEKLHCCNVEWTTQNGKWKLKELPGTDFSLNADLVITDFSLNADLVILAMGFLHVAHNGLIKSLSLKLDDFGNLSVNDYQTSEDGIFAAGDAVTGTSLVVRAINGGREAAIAIDDWLQKHG
jgi:NADPH-dependent glutamate synthase beta subunit-like oxidoreductase